MASLSVIGAGYVGLTTAACMADLGHKVVCSDIDRDKISLLNHGQISIVEEGLAELVAKGRESGNLSFVVGAESEVDRAEIVFLCVPTPQRIDGSADMSYIVAAVSSIAPLLKPGCIVVNKSTVPVGSTTVVEATLSRGDILVVSNPEFLREGSAIYDFMHPDRIVIGSDDQGAAIRVASLYSKINAPLVTTDPSSAETIKYASNAFLATKLSFVNAIANLCEAVGADIRDVILGMGYDRRIGFEFLKPGPGWGGSCFPKDTQALVKIAEEGGYDFKLLKGVLSANNEHRDFVAKAICDMARVSSPGPAKVAVLGLTFKANTDDLRESPSIEIALKLAKENKKVVAYDPTITPKILGRLNQVVDQDMNGPAGSIQPELVRLIEAGVELSLDPYAVCDRAHVVAILTEWDEFRWYDYDKIGKSMASRAIFDGRNLLESANLKRLGFNYRGIGR